MAPDAGVSVTLSRLVGLRRAMSILLTNPVISAPEALSMGIVNKVLHAPITKLRESSRAGAGRSWLELVHELFALGRRP